jgi:CRP/FNR family transcriptional regulator, cyclic AMP receptor protein
LAILSWGKNLAAKDGGFMLNTLVTTSAASEGFPVSAFTRQHNARVSPYGLPVGDHCVSSALRAHCPSSLGDASLAELDRIAHTTAYPEGAVLFVEGQIPRGVYVLCQGRVKLMTTNRDGKTLIMRIVQPGEILGLQSMVTGKPYDLTVETLQPSQLAFINRADFLRFIKEHADACLHVTQQLSNECQSAYEMVRSIGLSHSVSEKLARLLLQWCADGRVIQDSIRLKVSLTHEEMAQLIGTSRETVTRTLGELKKRRVLELTGSTLLIRNRAALEGLAGA